MTTLPPLLTCTTIAEEGLLIQLVDHTLAAQDADPVLMHVRDCTECLLTLAKVLEIHGQVVIEAYWSQVQQFDPQRCLEAE